MLTKATAGLKPCATVDEPSGNNGGGCAFCTADADGYGAKAEAPLCDRCAKAFGTFYSDVLGVRDE